MLLINDGLIAPGDTLIHHEVGSGDTYHAVVEADGWVTTDIRRYQGPTAALTKLVGSHINGWANWVHVKSGKTLRQLRDEGDEAS
jgi:hypothetical protein